MSKNPYRIYARYRETPKKRKRKKESPRKKPKIDKSKLAIKITPQHNIYSSYHPEWPKKRKEVLNRDGFHCRICLSDFALEVHHIDSDRSNNKTTNLVTLCGPCHRAVHRESYKPWEHDVPPPWGYLGEDE